MSDAAAATAKVVKKRATGGSAKAKKTADHPKYSEMIKAALGALKERGGSSRHAILKYIITHYKLGQDERVVNAHLKMALRAGVKNGSLNQAKGSGAAGSFRLGEKAEKKKKVVKAKKPKAAGSPKKAKKPKKAAAAGAAKVKKPKAAKKAKSPAKATKKPKVAKSPKKPKAAKAAKPKATKAKKTVAKK